jgi:hypothetical protein
MYKIHNTTTKYITQKSLTNQYVKYIHIHRNHQTQRWAKDLIDTIQRKYTNYQ